MQCLAADAINGVSSMHDKDGITYFGKAMMLCGMALNISGLREEW